MFYRGWALREMAMSDVQPRDESSAGDPADTPAISRTVACPGCGTAVPRSELICGRCGRPNSGHPRIAQDRANRVMLCTLTAYVFCFGFALAGWLMARKDLAEIAAGVRHPSAKGKTQAARQLALWNLGLHLLGAVVLAVGLGVWVWIELHRPAGQ